MKPTLQDAFASPSSEFRGKPFWAWNGALEEAELRRQIRVFKRMGLGGFFMHSRVGLATPYLGDAWMKVTGACIDEARRLGMEAWLYDEDRWPSGAAGGLVTREERYRMRKLVMTETRDAAAVRWTPDTLAVFAARIDGPVATGVRRLARGARVRPPAEGESLLVFTVETDACSDWFNGYTYLDTMNPDAVRAFIQVTHEAYRKRFGEDFGRVVPGIFTDEPHHGATVGEDGPGRTRTPWTGRLPAEFRKRYGYDLLPHLMELFFDVEGVAITRARWHYHDCIAHLFVTAFAKQVFDWCEREGVAFTGHVLCEDTLSSQTHIVSSAMRFYEYMQAPGMDLLTERWRVYDTAKQVASAARQFGRRWRLTETYGCTGWDFPFAGHKALGDWQAALGINLRCHHLSWYTMEGEAKRDYPAGIFFQSPWWELYPAVEDYFSRIHAVMTRGREVRDVLVIHPVESMWVSVKRGWGKLPATKELDGALIALRDSLLTRGVDFDYGDEDILARHGRIVRRGGVPELVVKQAAYRVVVVPPLKTVRSTTLALLRRFVAAGGRVVFAGGAATHVDAVPSDEALALAAACVAAPAHGAALAEAVGPAGYRVRITDGEGDPIPPALYLLREDDDAWYCFICNTGHSQAQLARDLMGDVLARDRREEFADVRVSGFAGAAGAPEEWDPNTGERFKADARRGRKGGWEIRTSLPALGSRLFVVPKRQAEGAPRALRKVRRVVASRSLSARTWRVKLSEANVLVLDRPRYRLGGGAWKPETEILRVDRAVREAMGIPRRSGSMKQPWAQEIPAQPPTLPVALEYTFEVKHVPSGSLQLALERPERFEIEVNGQRLDPDAASGWWTDPSLRTLPVDAALLHAGTNRVRLACAYEPTHGLEIVYLLGQFGVRVSGVTTTLTAPVSSVKLGDWCPQGLPFYSGHVTYLTPARVQAGKGQRVVVCVPGYRGVAVRVLVDGKPMGLTGWAPCEVDITDAVRPGEPFTLGLQVVGHRRNSHGPHHLTERWPVWTGPGEFVSSDKRWQETYQTVPCGLMAAPSIEVRA